MRRLRPDDAFLLRVATWLDLNWCGERFTFAQLDDDPHLAAYHRTPPEFGFVSGAEDEPTGVVWVTLFPADAPGYGFVRPGVPELSVCVLPGYRGAGRGTALVGAAVQEARLRSFPALSLSVEDGNPARRLYQRLGFAAAPSARHPGTMVLPLVDGDPPG